MPMRLFKRLSEKNLRKRAQSLDVKAIESELVPPLPPPKSPYRYNSLESLPQGLATIANTSRAPPHPNAIDSTTGSDPRSNTEADHFPASVGKQAKVSDELAELWTNVATKTPNKADKALEKMEGKIAMVQTNQGGTAIVNGITTVLNATGGMQAIEQGINHFLEGSTTLLNVLNSVAKLHPFIGVAVMAFRTAYTLEVNRRGNDKKIIALHVEMQDMMAILVQLKNVNDVNEKAPDGSNIKDRIKKLAREAAEDIKACSNACDIYSKKKLVVKVLMSTSWKEQLVRFSGVFTQRRTQFEFALTIHTARGVDTANKTLGDVDQTTRDMKAKVDMMMKMFEKFMPTEEKEMAKLVERKGGAKACQEDDKILQELSGLKSGNSVPTGPRAGRKADAKTASDLDDIRKDLHLEPAAAMEKNMATFMRKFELQNEELEREVTLLVKGESDRVISAVTAGPHNKIIDLDVQNIWKEMGWRGNVKARHFVMALRDHFHDKWHMEEHLADPTADILTTHNTDEWALEYLSVIRLQPVSEAFDDDASGFVTVAEVNAFTKSRPMSWSLPHWIAYWAIGWHQTLYHYAEKIRNLLSKMFAIMPKILKENMDSINEYLSSVYNGIVTLQTAVTPCSISEGLQAKFRSYVEAEEERLRTALEKVNYDIDARDTLTLITGPGRIERFILPLLYILLKHHFEIFRLSRNMHLHPDELDDAADTIYYVLDAVTDRVTALRSTFKQQKLDVKQEFLTFAHGLYSHYSESDGLWAPDIIKDMVFYDEPYDDAAEAQKIDHKKILNYPEDQEERDFAAYEVPAPTARAVPVSIETSPLSAVLGPWHGFIYERGDTTPSDGMISMDFSLEKVTDKELHFQTSGKERDTSFTVVGNCTSGDTENLINVSLKRTYPVRYFPSYWRGQLDKSTDTIMGKCGFESDYNEHTAIFVLKRTAPEYLCFRPSPEEFQEDKVGALWTYACSAIKGQVRRKFMSWEFLKARRDSRKRFIELYIRDNAFGRDLDEDEKEELNEWLASFTTEDSQFYHSLAEYQIRRTTTHFFNCDHCKGPIGGARLICLICQSTYTWNTVDLCDTPECVAAVVGKEDRPDLPRPHLPTHDLVKVRQVVHTRQFGTLYRESKAALQKSRAIFERGAMPRPAPDGGRPVKSVDMAKKRLSTMEKTTPHCIGCKKPVSQPCWFCVNCQEETFICMNCDMEQGGISIDHSKEQNGISIGDHSKEQSGVLIKNHNEEHTLVRCQPLVDRDEAVISMEDRLARVEKLLESMIQKFGVEKIESA